MTRDPWRDETAVHHCPHPDHAELGVHLHEVEPRSLAAVCTHTHTQGEAMTPADHADHAAEAARVLDDSHVTADARAVTHALLALAEAVRGLDRPVVTVPIDGADSGYADAIWWRIDRLRRGGAE